MIWLLIYPGYKDGHPEISLLILENPFEHTEIEGAEDIFGWFYGDEHIVVQYNWYHDENTNEACKEKYFAEDTSYLFVRHSYEDWEDFLFQTIFEDKDFEKFAEREL